jgi:hypothetical protein
MCSPELRAAIQQIIESDKLLLGRALSVQFNRLFVPALKQIPSLHPLPVILIDGLDECEAHLLQTQTLQLLIGAIREQYLPIHLIVSRPEPHLRDFLDNTPDICRQLELPADDDSAYKDLGSNLCNKLARILREQARFQPVYESERRYTGWSI